MLLISVKTTWWSWCAISAVPLAILTVIFKPFPWTLVRLTMMPLSRPTFHGNEKAYVNEMIDSAFVSSVGKFVDDFERKIEAFTGSAKAVATVNGTAALHSALYMAWPHSW